jgi:hypothetical protein
VEAKADEPFGETIGDTCTNVLKRSARTGAVRRVRALLQMVFGETAEPHREPYASLRYQLLTATAGTALQARIDGARRAALVIHEFLGSKTSTVLLERNAADLQAFLGVLNRGSELAFSSGYFAGPWNIRIGPADGDTIQLLLGKVVTELDSC